MDEVPNPAKVGTRDAGNRRITICLREWTRRLGFRFTVYCKGSKLHVVWGHSALYQRRRRGRKGRGAADDDDGPAVNVPVTRARLRRSKRRLRSRAAADSLAVDDLTEALAGGLRLSA